MIGLLGIGGAGAGTAGATHSDGPGSLSESGAVFRARGPRRLRRT
jgi:hypothetical protein